MLEYFKNIADKNSCSTGAVCSVHPSVNSLYEIILLEISEISFYVVKLKEFGFLNKETNSYLVESLSIFLINTSFNPKKYLGLISKLNAIRKETKELYLEYCKNNNLPYETINKNLDIEPFATISKLIEYSEKITTTRQKNFNNQKQNLFELIVLMTKLASINIVKMKKFIDDDSFDYEIIRFFSLTNSYSIRNEKIKRKILEFSKLALQIKRKLYKVLEEKFGKKESTTVNLTLESGHNILVSGDDFDELDEVLKTLENYDVSEKINVYTNGTLFLANLYPYFKNNKFLKGHYGTDNAEYDFSNFKGAILITQNFVQKIDSLYRGELFSKKLISFTKVVDIENNNYKPLIETALKLDKTENQKKNDIKIELNKDKLLNLKNEEIVFILGRSNNEIQNFKNSNKDVVFLSTPLEGDLLLEKIDDFKKENKKITIFFSECTLLNFDLLLALLDYGFEMYLVHCSNILINPHVIEALKEHFNIKTI